MPERELQRGLARDAAQAGRWTLELGSDWCVRSYFGGMALARLLRVVEAESERRDLVPLGASAVFARPLEPGRAEAAVEILRETRSTLFARSELRQGTEREPAVSVTAVYRTPVEPGDDDAEPDFMPPPAPEPAGPGDFRGIQGHVEWRCLSDWAAREPGSPAGADTGELVAWIRPRAATGGARSPYWLAVAADLLGPAVAAVAPVFPFYVATVSLGVQFLRESHSDWLVQRVRGGVVGHVAHCGVELRDEDGRLVATASQRAILGAAEPHELPFCVTAFGDGS